MKMILFALILPLGYSCKKVEADKSHIKNMLWKQNNVLLNPEGSRITTGGASIPCGDSAIQKIKHKKEQ